MASDAARQAVKQLEDAATQLQLQGDYVAALEVMERGLILRRAVYGLPSPQVTQACSGIGNLCNLLAMSMLQESKFDAALELLRKARVALKSDPKGLAVTYNNFACVYRRQSKLRLALSCVEKALALEESVEGVTTLADTHLNLCVLLSLLARHKDALGHAQTALRLLSAELSACAPVEEGSTRKALSPQRATVMAIAYHNVGVELEFVREYGLCVDTYTRGLSFCEEYLGGSHPLTVTLQASLTDLLTNKRALKHGLLPALTKLTGATAKAKSSS